MQWPTSTTTTGIETAHMRDICLCFGRYNSLGLLWNIMTNKPNDITLLQSYSLAYFFLDLYLIAQYSTCTFEPAQSCIWKKKIWFIKQKYELKNNSSRTTKSHDFKSHSKLDTSLWFFLLKIWIYLLNSFFVKSPLSC